MGETGYCTFEGLRYFLPSRDRRKWRKRLSSYATRLNWYMGCHKRNGCPVDGKKERETRLSNRDMLFYGRVDGDTRARDLLIIYSLRNSSRREETLISEKI